MNKNKFAPVPPMGWNSYDYYDTTVNEEQVKANADYMAANLKQYGWEYIVIDIEWYAHKAGSMRDQFQYIPFSKLEMDEYSRLLPDPERFPSSADGSGFTHLADYIHSLGLKFGIHIMRGIPRIAAHNHMKIYGCDTTADMVANAKSICRWNPDMYGVRDSEAGQAYYDSIISLYASWGVDFIKCDDICNTSNASPASEEQYSARHEIEMIAKAIEKSGRSIVLSLSPGPALIEKAWHYEKYANMWRITDDFWDRWDLLKNMFERCELWQNHVWQGCYPDCDMLPLGKVGKGFHRERETGFTREEQRTMMTLWCLFGSPLMLGAEMTMLDEWTVSLLTNEKILAMLPPSCRPYQICRDDKKAVWMACNEKSGELYVALFNLSDCEDTISVALPELKNCIFAAESERIESLPDDTASGVEVETEELWTGEKGSSKNSVIAASIPPHGCAVYQIR